MDILGLSCFYHDAAAALLRDGELAAARPKSKKVEPLLRELLTPDQAAQQVGPPAPDTDAIR